MNTEEKVIQVPIEDIIPNRFQPRLAFDEEGLKELSDSIKQHGIIQPLVLRRLGNKFEIIAGERRYKASTMAGLRSVPAIISNIDDNKSAEIALVENIQRRNLTAIEEAKSYKNLLDRGYMTQEQLASKMGVSQSTIANKMRLLNLSNEVQDALLEEKISERHARSLLSIPKEEQGKWLNKIITKRMTVRQLDLEIKKEKGIVTEDIPLVNPTPDLQTMINNSVDINSVSNAQKNQIMDKPKEDETDSSSVPPIIPNKFFNFLEDEAANMNMEIPEEKINTFSPKEEIEVLDDFDIIPDVKEEKRNDNDPIMPFFFENNETPKSSNVIEEVDIKANEDVIDPMSMVNILDPNYDKKQKEEKSIDLKTAINDIRNFTNLLQEKGFELTIDELDMENNYEFIIKIKK